MHAADDGEVIYSDVLRGYGNVIIVRHTHGLATVYAHNQTNRVREGQRVRRGEVIGNVGDSGRTTGANLHFEVRKDNVARDPLYFLPAVEQVAVPSRLRVTGAEAGRRRRTRHCLRRPSAPPLFTAAPIWYTLRVRSMGA